MTTYTWNVNTLETAKSEDGLNDVVKCVHWRLTASDGINTASAYSTVLLDAPDVDNFINFLDLTEAQVISWVESKLDVDAVKVKLEADLLNLTNPSVVVKSAPWV